MILKQYIWLILRCYPRVIQFFSRYSNEGPPADKTSNTYRYGPLPPSSLIMHRSQSVNTLGIKTRATF